MASPRPAPFGSWTSPITTALIVGETVVLGQPSFCAGKILWTESRPSEGGRSVLVRSGADLTPAPFNVRTRVNEYGGGAYLAGPDTVWFSHDGDRRVYALSPGQPPRPVTPAGKMRFADFEFDAARGRLICVREDHNVTGTQAETTLASLPLVTESEGTVLVRGSDFYSTPRLSPDGSRLAWLSWNHPNMPWDGTELRVAEIRPDGSLCEARLVAGGPEESIYQPEWSPDGLLHFVSDRSGFWNIFRERDGRIEALTDRQAEFGRPQWNFCSTTYGFDSAQRIVCLFCERGVWRLGLLDTGTKRLDEIVLPYSEMKSLRTAPGRALFLAGSPGEPEALVLLDLASRRTEVIRRSSASAADAGYLSPAVPIEFPTARGLTAHALYYAPRNRDFSAPAGQLPPLLVDCHGGPTSAATSTLDLETQFWTSRGLAVVDVNYGGSTGYGRAYRERLNGQWGIVDVEDCEAAARHLVERGLADPKRVAIRGGSAGGYTTMRALTRSRVFCAGASYYGIGDLEVLADDYGHKFEWKYSVRLVGPWPERRDLYRERSPVHEADRIVAPVIFFQGLDDVVCPPCQTEIVVDALRKRGAPFAYLAFEKEGHGFRRAETIRRALEAELSFYSRVFGFEPAGGAAPIPFENVPETKALLEEIISSGRILRDGSDRFVLWRAGTGWLRLTVEERDFPFNSSATYRTVTSAENLSPVLASECVRRLAGIRLAEVDEETLAAIASWLEKPPNSGPIHVDP
ncbi:MAG: peptidase S9 prolyl oligopeptidase active site [Planctomycetota bacterium]|nr:MAG: peptidase S9 prolyl oligopeptidase active site [Planctomycetota bacterium]